MAGQLQCRECERSTECDTCSRRQRQIPRRPQCGPEAAWAQRPRSEEDHEKQRETYKKLKQNLGLTRVDRGRR